VRLRTASLLGGLLLSRVVLEFNEAQDSDIRTFICREGESIHDAINRVIQCEVKAKKLDNDLRVKHDQ